MQFGNNTRNTKIKKVNDNVIQKRKRYKIKRKLCKEEK